MGSRLPRSMKMTRHLFYNIADVGRLVPGSNESSYYYLTDHPSTSLRASLGSIRVTVDESGNVVSHTDYYPFGMTMPGREMTSLSEDFYKYNGKQLDDDYGLNWHDYGWRPYDAEIGRFVKVDRFAEKYPSLSSYQYAANNPALFVDVNGDTIIVSEAMLNSEALALFLSTEQGKAWASQFAYEGQEITVAGKTFSFENAGKFSTQNLNFAGIDYEVGAHTVPSNSISGDFFIGQEGVQSYNIFIGSGGSLIDQADALFHETQHAYMFAAGGANGRGGYGKINIGRMALLQHIGMLTPGYFEPHRSFLKEIGASSLFVSGKIESLMWQAGIDPGLSGRFPTHIDVNKLIPEVMQILLIRKKFMEK